MEQFLIAALGAVAVVLALILASQGGARNPREAAPHRPARGLSVAAAALLLLLLLTAAAFAALGWRGTKAQRRALAAETQSLAAKVKEMAARHRHRAWVHASLALDGPMIIKRRAVSIAAHYRLDNSGDAPATDIHIASAVVPREAGNAAALQRSLCARTAADGTAALAHDTLFPGQSRDVRRIEGVGAEIVNGGVVPGAAAGGEFWWIGCIAYRTQDDPARHRSGFVYALAETGAGPGGIVPINLADQIIPKARLALIPHSGGFSAD